VSFVSLLEECDGGSEECFDISAELLSEVAGLLLIGRDVSEFDDEDVVVPFSFRMSADEVSILRVN
jgi:hypothetical protein